MTKDEAFRALEDQKQAFYARIPSDAPRKCKRYLNYVVEEEMGSAQMHLKALYESNLEVDRSFGPLPQHAAHPKYSFWVEGIRRHVERCEASVQDQRTSK